MKTYHLECDQCGIGILEDEEYYHIGRKDLCRDCAEDWLEQHKCYFTPFADDGDDRE